jgi:hypothetical protein
MRSSHGSRRLTHGLPTGFVAALAALVLVAILLTVATREPKETRGFAEFTLHEEGCVLNTARQLNARDCLFVRPGVYRISFTKSLEGSTAVASRAACCPGRIAASVEDDRAVRVVVQPSVRQPVRASILLP